MILIKPKRLTDEQRTAENGESRLGMSNSCDIAGH